MFQLQRVIVLFAGTALACLPQALGQPDASAQPARAPVVLPEIQVQDTPLEEVFQLLRAADPQLKLLVVRDPGAPPDEPVISNLSVRQVTVDQVLMALAQAYPELRVSSVPGEDGAPAIWTVRVRDARPQVRSNPERTRVFRLREAINQLEADLEFKHRAEARDALLVLMETALKVSGETRLPVLQVHQATETLVFRGTPEQEELIEDTLRAVNPAPRPKNLTQSQPPPATAPAAPATQE